MSNDERFLGWELVDAVHGRAPRSDRWRGGAGTPEASLTGPGTGNLKLLLVAVRLWREGTPIWIEWCLEFLRLSADAWMGRELVSRIYRVWHLIAVQSWHAWARFAGHAELEAAAARWLAAWWAAMRALRADDGTIAPVGMRAADDPGADGDLGPGLVELAAEIALYLGPGAAEIVGVGSDVATRCDRELRGASWAGIHSDRTRWARPAESATRQVLASAPPPLRAALLRWDRGAWPAWERILLYRFASQMRAAAAPAREAPSAEAALATWPRSHRTLVRIELAFAPGFRAVWIERNVNSNTGPILAAWWEPVAGWQTCPPEHLLEHIRQRFDRGTATRAGRVVTVTSSLYAGGPWRIQLPAGARISALGPSPAPPPGQDPEPDPPPPPTGPDPELPPAPPAPPAGEPRRDDSTRARIVLVCLLAGALIVLLRGCW